MCIFVEPNYQKKKKEWGKGRKGEGKKKGRREEGGGKKEEGEVGKEREREGVGGREGRRESRKVYPLYFMPRI
jgi:hypothetical protein